MSAPNPVPKEPGWYVWCFDAYFLWGVLLAIFLWLMMGGVARATGIDGLDMHVSFDPGQAVVQITAKNVGEKNVGIYDSLSSKLTVPYFLSYSLRDDEHGVITKTDRYGDGFLSSNMLRSSLLESPEQRRLIEILPGEELSKRVNLFDLMGGTKKYWSIKPAEVDVAYIKFKIRIYADKDFSKYVDVESDECPVSGAYLASH